MLRRSSAVALVAATLVSCATSLPTLPPDYTITNNDAVVMGRVIGSSVAWKLFDTACILTVRNAATGERYDIRGEQDSADSYFAVALPGGRYTLSELKQGNMAAYPPVQFDVSGGTVTYIGTLRFNKGGLGESIAASMGGRPKVLGNWAVENDYAAALAHFREKHPTLRQEVTTSLMVLGQ